MSKRVLIVDDSMLMRKMVRELGRRRMGHRRGSDRRPRGSRSVQGSPGRRDARHRHAGNRRALALEHILEFDAHAKLVVVSALNQTKLISDAIRKGAQDFIAKPFLPEQLQQTMDSCMIEPIEA